VNENPFRLSSEVVPTDYRIAIKPNFETFTFQGKETISIYLKKTTRSITLNAADLIITSALASSVPGSSIGQVVGRESIAYDAKHETVTITFPAELISDCITLTLEFDGVISDKMNGFYRTWYMVNGEKHWGGATQFEATDARRAFPCFDEPAFKATFDIRILAPAHMTVLSNMPVASHDVQGNTQDVIFETTPPMSTYLVAWVIAELEYLEAKTSRDLPVRVYTTPGKKEHGQFALETAIDTLKYFEQWFGIPYALPKLDMVAMPDFAAGAMENWGLVTYRETASLVDPKAPTAAVKQRVAEVVDHELAHQWFGNLATMLWWSHLWLNEGFASRMGPKAIIQRFPEWDYETQYVSEDHLSALHEDSLVNTHAIEVEVQNPAEISEVFDAISYSKGSVVNRMLEYYLGEETFRKGLNRYLTQYAYRNATTDDLWRALEEASGKPVMAIMADYTRQPGYPVVAVGRQQKNATTAILTVVQKRFIADGSNIDNLKWHIPLGITTEKNRTPTYHEFTESAMILEVSAGPDEWIKINPGHSGYYRVAYSPRMLEQLIPAIERKELGPIDRLCILDDTFAIAKSGMIPTTDALSLLKAYCDEDDYNVLTTLAGCHNTLDTLLQDEPSAPALARLVRQQFKPTVQRLGWSPKEGESHIDVLTRSLALSMYGSFLGNQVAEKAKDLFWHFRNTPQLHQDIRSVVYTLAAQYGDADEYVEFVKMYRATDQQEEKVRILRSLGRFRDFDLLEKITEFALSSEVRGQDTYIPILSMASHPNGGQVAWEFVKNNWEELKKRFNAGGLKMMGSFIEVPVGFNQEFLLDDVKEFFASHQLESTKRGMKQVVETIEMRIHWLERDRESINTWFASQK